MPATGKRPFVWVDRTWMPSAKAALRLDRVDALAAPCLAESLSVEAGRPLHLAQHLARLAEGCRALAWAAPDRGFVAKVARQIPPKNAMRQGGLRLRWWGGLERPLLLAFVLDAPALSLKPVRLMTSAVRHYGPDSLNARAKVAHMLPNWLAKAETEAWAEDGLRLTPDGMVAEGVWTNIVALKRGVARTPPLASGILEGVTRGRLLASFKRRGLPVREEPLTRYDLWTADKVWVLSSLRGPLEVASVDGRTVGA
jgi:branched-subunit amino acid aminotransferase/4-amino-4-deoxychorismate lyase